MKVVHAIVACTGIRNFRMHLCLRESYGSPGRGKSFLFGGIGNCSESMQFDCTCMWTIELVFGGLAIQVVLHVSDVRRAEKSKMLLVRSVVRKVVSAVEPINCEIWPSILCCLFPYVAIECYSNRYDCASAVASIPEYRDAGWLVCWAVGG